MDRLYTVKQACEYLACSRSTLEKLLAAGEITVIRIGAGGGGRRLRESDLARFIESRKSRDQKAANETIDG
jgi:excisionase family DNA binding protein